MLDCWRKIWLAITIVACCLCVLCALAFSILSIITENKTDSLRSVFGIGILLSFFAALVLLVIVVYLIDFRRGVPQPSTGEDCPLVPVK